MNTTYKATSGFIAFHPGSYIIDELKARHWSQKQFAAIIQKSTTEVNELIKGKRNITPEWALLISSAFQTSVDLRLQLQTNYDMYATHILSQKKPYVKKLSLIIKRAMKEKKQEYAV